MKLYGSKQMLWLNRDSGCGTVMIFMVLSACIYTVYVVIRSIVMILYVENTQTFLSERCG